LSNSIGGTPVVDFNPASYNPSVSQTQWTSATGEVWTINTGTAATGYKGAVITKSIAMSDGVDDVMEVTNSSLKIANSSFISVFKLLSNVSFSTFYGLASDNSTLTAGAIVRSGNNANSLQISPFTSVFKNNISIGNGTSNYNSIITLNILALFQQDGTSITYTVANNYTLFRRNDASSSFSNGVLNSYIQSSSVLNSTQRTAMYNYLRSINNNAF
jgi:hypothetical protein